MQPKRARWALLLAERRRGAGRTGAQQIVALCESRRRGIDPPGFTSADATLRNARYHRCKAVEDYLKTARIKLLFLPPYAPRL